MTEKTFILTFQTYVDAEDLDKALQKGKKHMNESKYLINLIGVMEMIE